MYTYDALDRVVRQLEQHEGKPDQTTVFDFLALSNLATRETQSGGGSPATKTYSYDALGERVGFRNVEETKPTEDFLYGYDAHGSVSLLQQGSASVRATYGYTPYGGIDPALTFGDRNPDDSEEPPEDPLNFYRYSGKRLDTGSGTTDMGARRYHDQTGRFLQPDLYHGALANLGLGADPLTGNRYALAGGNPISFIEWDGHDPWWEDQPRIRKPETVRDRPAEDKPRVEAWQAEMTAARDRDAERGQGHRWCGHGGYWTPCTWNEPPPAAGQGCEGTLDCTLYGIETATLFGGPVARAGGKLVVGGTRKLARWLLGGGNKTRHADEAAEAGDDATRLAQPSAGADEAAGGIDDLARFTTNRHQRLGRLATAGTPVGKVRNFDVPDPAAAANRVARSLTQGPGVTVTRPRPGVTVHYLPEGGQVVLRSPAGSRSRLWAVDVYNVPGVSPINTHFRPIP